ncbi:MAG: hypothetical protein DRR16_06285 [Candidatus Parabeggiatoa sp. nov. 3]|nr:MAG: hypothetical protein DRR00_04560 [Gammaproteobacteria bacterium]RKZ68922.1 MAG: hypothetical protein DRQ99_02425 [Gammaproteobacteria bacterium]RKZ87894.1 MAG: hypothetical protein DRR16_06285 [Gammaproteobacteria bacterium]
MLQSYKAVLKGQQLEWIDDRKVSANNQPFLVYVTLLKEEPIPQQLKLPGQPAIDRLEEIVDLNGAVSKIVPLKWQQEMPQERIEPIENLQPSSLMSKLKQIKIQAPKDFAKNIDAYLNGEKNVE